MRLIGWSLLSCSQSAFQMQAKSLAQYQTYRRHIRPCVLGVNEELKVGLDVGKGLVFFVFKSNILFNPTNAPLRYGSSHFIDVRREDCQGAVTILRPQG